MESLGKFSPTRALVALATSLVADTASTVGLVHDLPPRSDGSSAFGALLHLVSLATISACTTYVAVLLAVLIHEHSSTGRATSPWCPRALRPALIALCSAGAVASTIGSATASTADVGAHRAASASTALPSLDRPLSLPPRRASTTPGSVTVRPGDSLWSLVRERHPDADNTATARLVQEWYRADAAAIGADPDLIHVGLVLRLPPDEAPR
ncbi:MAG TPA: hypothetical protein VF426_04360 [Marmoricola sp.]